MSTSKNPTAAPPTWAKCAILSSCTFTTPPKTSSAIIPEIAHLAFIGTGIGIMIISVFGNKYPKAARIPIMAPDAPTV